MTASAIRLDRGGGKRGQREDAGSRRQAGMGNLLDVLLWVAGAGRAGCTLIGMLVNGLAHPNEAFP
jgi:hypothetical protein